MAEHRFPFATAMEAGTILFLSPLVFASRMNSLTGTDGVGAMFDLQRFAAEKMFVAGSSMLAGSIEAMQQAASLGRSVARSDYVGIATVADRIGAAAAKPVAKRVRRNARSLAPRAGK